MTAADAQPAPDSPRRDVRGIAIGSIAGISSVLVLIGAAIALFFNPVWVGFEQARAAADLWTGWDIATVREVTGAVVMEVFLGPGTFAQTVGGVPVFTAAEIGHMADVRRVVLTFYVIVLVAVIALVATWVVDRRRISFWHGVQTAAGILAVAVVAVGVFLAFFFDTAFEIFHRLFFAAGSYTFDPRTDRLVQLLPDQLWTETSILLAIAIIAAAVALWAIARQRRRAALARAAVA